MTNNLSLRTFSDWYSPRIDLVIVTNDRPHSLLRLIQSLKSSLFFGDRVNLHIYLEQTADNHTRAIARDVRWEAGDLHVRHRVIMGGLLPAVVESWYPSSNDSYGILLEDDVEVSPMFYAFAKMAILRYRYVIIWSPRHVEGIDQFWIRYGAQSRHSGRLFGISLYQQKNNELRPEGRRAFDAQALFASHGLQHINTPYLSQVPCSWGAVYFPEHWREYHDYLVARLSESTHDISTVIVPDIRSNKWSRSWKKFFIELVYLRGYVMLYPNYDDYTSLSTNHLEVGAHVRGDQSDEEFEKKRAQFDLPLMPLRASHTDAAIKGSDGHSMSLLDLPFARMPLWEMLPIVDLWGRWSFEAELIHRGLVRHEQISGCSPLNGSRSDYQASSLLCPIRAHTTAEPGGVHVVG